MLAQAVSSAKSLCSNATDWNGHKLVKARVDVDMNQLRNIASALKDIDSEMVAVMGGVADGKPALCLLIPQTLVNEKGMDAGAIVREGAKLIQGGGGGQKTLATAGGKNPDAIDNAIDVIANKLCSL